jgi:hypothetical protein
MKSDVSSLGRSVCDKAKGWDCLHRLRMILYLSEISYYVETCRINACRFNICL